MKQVEVKPGGFVVASSTQTIITKEHTEDSLFIYISDKEKSLHHGLGHCLIQQNGKFNAGHKEKIHDLFLEYAQKTQWSTAQIRLYSKKNPYLSNVLHQWHFDIVPLIHQLNEAKKHNEDKIVQIILGTVNKGLQSNRNNAILP